MLAALTLVLLGCSAVFAQEGDDGERECYQVYPTNWHFLNPDFVTVPAARRGMLLAELDGQNGLFSLLPRDDGPFQDICGIDKYMTDEANKYFDSEKTQEFPCFHYKNGKAWRCDDVECPQQVYLDCLDEIVHYKLAAVGLYTYNEEQDEIVPAGSEGLLLAEFAGQRNKSHTVTGAVCDRYFNDHAADLMCQKMGYMAAINWGSRSFSRYIPLSERRKRGIRNVQSGIECSRNDTDIGECRGYENVDYNTFYCNIYDSLWLNCYDEEVYDWNPIPTDLGLYRTVKGQTELERGSEGLLLAEFTSKRNESSTILGALCDVGRALDMYDSTFSDHAADLVCQRLGYTSAVNWGSHEFNDYVNAWEIHDRGIKSMIQGLKCSEDATNISECGGYIYLDDVINNYSCKYSQFFLWLSCV